MGGDSGGELGIAISCTLDGLVRMVSNCATSTCLLCAWQIDRKLRGSQEVWVPVRLINILIQFVSSAP